MYRKLYSTLFFIVVVWTKTNCFNVITGNLPNPSSISRLFKAFVVPIMRALPENNKFIPRADTIVDKVIKQKVAELRSFLQDNDIESIDDNNLFEEKDDTSIIEFLPKAPTADDTENRGEKFKTILRKYKKVREKINKGLFKESVSNKTKNLVIKTVDDLLAKLVGSQCKWKRTFRAKETNILADRWNEGFDKAKTVISNLLGNKTTNARNNESSDILDNLQILFRSIAGDAELLSKKYKIQCEFVPRHPKKSSSLNMLRNNWDKTDIEDEKCNIHICSEELIEYLNLFYNSLNDTSVSVIENYIEMYTRDVGTDGEEQQYVISLLDKVSNKTESNVLDIFIKETRLLKFNDKDNKYANVEVLTEFVKNVTKFVKENLTNEITSELETVREKIARVVKVDLKVNIDIDLGNLEKEFISKVCAIFRLCNGKYEGRRRITDKKKLNGLNVQLELTLDDVADFNNYRRNIDAKNSTIQGLNATRTTYNYNNFPTRQ